MSAQGGGRDDIDDLIRELRQLNEQLARMVDAIVRGAQEQSESSEEESIDKWRQGSYAPRVNSVNEYIDRRSAAAKRSDMHGPHFEKTGPEFLDNYQEVYYRGGENLERIDNALNKEEFKVFVGRLAIHYGAYRDLVEILEPGIGMFGFHRSEGLKAVMPVSYWPYLEMYGGLWYFPNDYSIEGIPDNPFVDEFSSVSVPPNPSSVLDLQLPYEYRDEAPWDRVPNTISNREEQQQVEAFFDAVMLRPGRGIDELNARMATAIHNRSGLELPDEYRGIVNNDYW